MQPIPKNIAGHGAFANDLASRFPFRAGRPHAFDNGCEEALSSDVKYAQAYDRYLDILRRDPNARAPGIQLDTVAGFHNWKLQMRAFDAARIFLGIKTPKEIQEANAAVRVEPGKYRIVEYVRHA